MTLKQLGHWLQTSFSRIFGNPWALLSNSADGTRCTSVCRDKFSSASGLIENPWFSEQFLSTTVSFPSDDTTMLMALNRHMLHNSLLKVQQHIVSSGNTIKAVASAAVTSNNGPVQSNRKSSSFQNQLSSSDSDGDDTLKKNPYYSAYADKLQALKK